MRNKAKTYAGVMVQSLNGATEKEAARKIQRLKKLLYKRGDFKQASSILREFSRAWRERDGKIATVVSAEALSGKAKATIEKSLAKSGYVLVDRVDEGVIGGTALYLGNEYVIDGTIKGKLQRFSKLLTISN